MNHSKPADLVAADLPHAGVGERGPRQQEEAEERDEPRVEGAAQHVREDRDEEQREARRDQREQDYEATHRVQTIASRGDGAGRRLQCPVHRHINRGRNRIDVNGSRPGVASRGAWAGLVKKPRKNHKCGLSRVRSRCLNSSRELSLRIAHDPGQRHHQWAHPAAVSSVAREHQQEDLAPATCPLD